MTTHPVNQIIHGDATEQLAALTTKSVQLIITDPPYLIGYRDRRGRTVANDNNPANVLPAFKEMHRVLRDGSFCIVFCGWSAIAEFSAAWEAAGFRTSGHLVWVKDYAASNYHAECRHESAWLLVKGRPGRVATPVSDVMPWVYTGNRRHPTEKAVAILKPLVEAYSRLGDLVLDPFSGSGSTSVAAALAGRRYFGIELDARYCQQARQRLAAVAATRQLGSC